MTGVMECIHNRKTYMSIVLTLASTGITLKPSIMGEETENHEVSNKCTPS